MFRGFLQTKTALIILLLCVLTLWGKDTTSSKKTKIRFGGIAEIGLDFIYTTDNLDSTNDGIGVFRTSTLKRIGRVELGMTVTPVKEVQLKFDLEYDHRFESLRIKKLYGRYRFENSDIRFGYMKKSFGLEEMTGREERPYYSRSILNNALEQYYLLGHDLTVQYRVQTGKGKIIAAFSWDGSSRMFGNIMGIWEFDALQINASGVYAFMPGVLPINDKAKHIFALNMGTRYTGKRQITEGELSMGLNPELHDHTSKNYPLFGSARVQQQFPISIGRKILNSIKPLWEVTILSERLDTSGIRLQCRPGINLYFTKKEILQWYTAIDLRFSSANQNDPLSIIQKGIISEIRIVW